MDYLLFSQVTLVVAWVCTWEQASWRYTRFSIPASGISWGSPVIPSNEYSNYLPVTTEHHARIVPRWNMFVSYERKILFKNHLHFYNPILLLEMPTLPNPSTSSTAKKMANRRSLGFNSGVIGRLEEHCWKQIFTFKKIICGRDFRLFFYHIPSSIYPIKWMWSVFERHSRQDFGHE